MSMVWKSREWKRAAKKLRNRYRLLVGELFSVVSNEEDRIARMELDEQLETLPSARAARTKRKLGATSYKQL
jgi:hypothetical protein